MRGAGMTLVALAAAALAAPALAGPAPTQVSVIDDEFTPENAEQALGASTRWTWDDEGDVFFNEHNVREDSKIFFSGPVTDDPSTIFTTSIASGKYHYYCDLHGTPRQGMEGTIKVRPTIGGFDGEAATVTWGDEDVQKPSQYDVKYRAGNGKWKDWVKNKTAVSGEFGANDKPVNVREGKTYSFRARTELRNKPEKASKFSPVSSFSIKP